MKIKIQTEIIKHLSTAQDALDNMCNLESACEIGSKHIRYVKLLLQTYKDTHVEVEKDVLDNLWDNINGD